MSLEAESLTQCITLCSANPESYSGLEQPAKNRRARSENPRCATCGKDAITGSSLAHGLLLQDFMIRLGIMKGNKQPFTILDDVSGTLKPVSSAMYESPPLMWPQGAAPARLCNHHAGARPNLT